MLEAVDVESKVDRETYRKEFPWLKTGMRELLYQVRKLHIPVVIVFEGWDTAGKGDAIQHVTEVLDPRGYDVHFISNPIADESKFPWLHRFWSKLPSRGRFGFFERSWYHRVLDQKVESNMTKEMVQRAYQEIERFENLLLSDDHILIKIWFHLSKKQQRKRLKAAEDDPFRRFVVSDVEWRHHGHYDEYFDAADEMLRKTNREEAPWHIIPAANRRFRRLETLRIISETLTSEIEQRIKTKSEPPPVIEYPPTISQKTEEKNHPLSQVDLTRSIDDDDYSDRLEEAQIRIHQLQSKLYLRKIPVSIVYEGWDAAGKGGSIKRLVKAMDPRGYKVIPVSKPTKEELDHHYLWRFWKNLPADGEMAIFDRSWYGRVMVERIEGFCTEKEWRQAYQEIREFELELSEHGMVLIKFWIHISKDEQLARFEARAQNPHKRWKLTEEDWRNRDKWDDYLCAVNDMIMETSKEHAPWTIISGNHKKYARIQAIETVIESLERALD